jgi:DNA gyrase subunit B
MPKLSSLRKTKETTKWCDDLQKKLNKNKLMSEKHKVVFKDKEILYSLEVYGVVAITSALSATFFDSADYKRIQKYSDEVESIFSSSSFVQKGQKEAKVSCFADAMGFLLKEAQKGQGFQRYKGLGEMNPDQLWDTTMNPESRTLLKVKVEDAIAADEVFSTLMGDEVEPRRNFIEDNALKVENLDY